MIINHKTSYDYLIDKGYKAFIGFLEKVILYITYKKKERPRSGRPKGRNHLYDISLAIF